MKVLIISGLQNAEFSPVRNRMEIIFKYCKEIKVAKIKV